MAGQLSLVESGKSVNSTDRQKALDAALAQIDRAFGKGSVMKLGSKEAMQVEAVSTGSLGLDIALGVGGLPRGRVIEIYGPESSGKTTLALHCIAEAQKTGGTAAFVDAEHALDPVYAKKLGVNIDEDARSAASSAAKMGITFPVLHDAEKRVAKLYDLSTMPTTLLIDRDGRLRHVHRGYRDGYELTYDQQVRELLKS